MNRVQALAIVGALTAVAGTASASTYQIVDGSFESPQGAFAYRPQFTDALFTGNAGVDGGQFGFATPPDGVQDGFLQSGAGDAVISLNVYGLIGGDTYSFSFYDAQRLGYGVDPYIVSVNGQTIYSGAPSSTAFTQVTTDSFVSPFGPIVITFTAPDQPGDNDTAIDAITLNGAPGATTSYLAPTPTVTAVPEPATWALMLTGFGLAGAAMRSRRRGVAA
jgi:hypothetical protein